MEDIQTVIDVLQDAKLDEYNCIRITDDVRCAMVRILMKQVEENRRREQADEDRVC